MGSLWGKLFIIMALILLLINKYNINNPTVEGFSQMKPFEVKKNDDLYDDFYVGYYDEIIRDGYKTDFEFKEICHTTKANKKNPGCDIVKKDALNSMNHPPM